MSGFQGLGGSPSFPQPKANPESRDGVGFSAKELDRWICGGGLETIMLETSEENGMPNVNEAYAKANVTIENAQAAYNKTLQTFRSAIKNDMASISASADKVKAESAKMHGAYTNAMTMLTSREMEAAIANAERLATALRAISELQSHSITFAVLDRKPA